MKAIDLFAGGGGFSTGARMAGVDVVWAANHWPEAVRFHSMNHPEAMHLCQDLHQADWTQVPAHDLLLASPCCQGHSRARGKPHNDPAHDASRSTAWAVVSALECHRPPLAIVENVPEFVQWALYPAWRMALEALGYSVAPHIVDAADFGTPQNRVRLFMVLARSKAPLMLNLVEERPIPAETFLDWEAGAWSKIERDGRAQNTLDRIANGRKEFGDRFLMSYYGRSTGGRSTGRPIGTITTADRWAMVRGDEMRMLTKNECRAAMGFPADYILPERHKDAIMMLGNAVCPPTAARVIRATLEAA